MSGDVNKVETTNSAWLAQHAKRVVKKDEENTSAFEGETVGDVGDNYSSSKSREIQWNKPSFKKTDKYEGESEESADFRNQVYRAGYDIKPDELKQMVNTTFGEDEKEKVLAFIGKLDKVTNPEEFKTMLKKTNNKLEQSIVNVYIANEQKSENTNLLIALTYDKTANFSKKLEHLNKGVYFDENGTEYKGEKYPATSYEKEAIEEILPVLMEAKMNAIIAKLEQEGSLKNIKSDKALRKLIIKEAEQSDGKDKVFRKFVNNNSSVTARIKRETDVLKRKEELKSISMKEIKKYLSEETIQSIQSYLNNNKNADGTYNLSEFIDVIKYRSGDDYMVNPDPEMDAIWRGFIAGAYGNDGKKLYDYVNAADFDKPHAKKVQTEELVKLCKYPIEKKDRSPQHLVRDGVVGAAAGATAFSQILINSETLTEVLGAAAGSATVETATEVIIEANLGTALLPIGVAMATGALFDLIKGKTNPERSCFEPDFDPGNPMYTHKDSFVQYLKDIGEYEKVKDILDQCEKYSDGTWDYNTYLSILAKKSGPGSKLNCIELNSKGTDKTNNGEIITTDKEVTDAAEEEVIQTINEDDIIFKKQARRSSWAHLTTLYDCGEKSLVEICGGNVNKAIRIIKIAQAVTDGNYSYERLNELYKLSIQGPQYLQNIEGIDYDVYYDVWANNFPPAVKLPTNLAGAERCEISEDEHELRLGYKLDPSQIANTQAAKGPANGTIIISSKIDKSRKQVMYGVAVPGQRAKWYASVVERNAEVQRLQDENPSFRLRNVNPNEFDEIVNKAK